jgi:outer membrane receptor for monomeric catechols
LPAFYAEDLQINQLINNYIDESLSVPSSELANYKPDYDKFETSYSDYQACDSCECCSVDETEASDLPVIYQHYESDEQFELSTIRKYVSRMHGSFSTGVIYSDYSNSSYLVNSLSLGFEINKNLSLYIHISDVEGL